jgi:hypothetical protein
LLKIDLGLVSGMNIFSDVVTALENATTITNIKLIIVIIIIIIMGLYH